MIKTILSNRIYNIKNEFKFHKFFTVSFLFCSMYFLTGCGTFRHLKYPYHHTYFPISSTNKGFTKEYPKSFTVYPFKNVTWEKTAALRAQRETAQSFSLIGQVASITETAKLASDSYSYEDAIKVARKQKSDAVIIGEVLTEDSIFMLIFAYNYVEMKMSIYDTKDGKVLWTGQGWAIATDFGGLIYWIPNPLIPGIKHIFWSRIVSGLYHRINMDTINKLRPDLVELK